MKRQFLNSIKYFLSVFVLSMSCSKDEAEQNIVQPVKEVNNSTRNLRPTTGEKPDLIIYAFSQYGSVSQDAINYNIPFLCSEKNIGTAMATGAFSDTLKVYQKIPIGSGLSTYYKYSLVDKFVRPSNIAINSLYFFVASIKFPKLRRPSSGKINLVIVSDGASKVFELNESNNMSSTIWNISLP